MSTQTNRCAGSTAGNTRCKNTIKYDRYRSAQGQQRWESGLCGRCKPATTAAAIPDVDISTEEPELAPEIRLRIAKRHLDMTVGRSSPDFLLGSFEWSGTCGDRILLAAQKTREAARNVVLEARAVLGLDTPDTNPPFLSTLIQEFMPLVKSQEVTEEDEERAIAIRNVLYAIKADEAAHYAERAARLLDKIDDTLKVGWYPAVCK